MATKNDLLIVEMSSSQLSVASNENKDYILEGIFGEIDSKNKNNRIYTEDEYVPQIQALQDKIKSSKLLGELDHPDSSVINLKNVSHNIKEVHWEGNDVVGTVEILPTPSGNILKELLRAGILLGISSRGMGSTQPMKDNKLLVGEDFELIGWDFVSNPSTHGAFMTPMNESVIKNIGTDVCGDFCKAQDLMREIITELG